LPRVNGRDELPKPFCIEPAGGDELIQKIAQRGAGLEWEILPDLGKWSSETAGVPHTCPPEFLAKGDGAGKGKMLDSFGEWHRGARKQQLQESSQQSAFSSQHSVHAKVVGFFDSVRSQDDVAGAWDHGSQRTGPLKPYPPQKTVCRMNAEC